MSDPFEEIAKRFQEIISATPADQSEAREKLESYAEKILDIQRRGRENIEQIMATEMENQKLRKAQSDRMKDLSQRGRELQRETEAAFLEAYETQNEILESIVRR